MKSENINTSKPHVLILNVTDEIDLRGSEKKHCFIKSLYLLHMEKHKKSYNNNKFKISALTWNDDFELPVGS